MLFYENIFELKWFKAFLEVSIDLKSLVIRFLFMNIYIFLEVDIKTSISNEYKSRDHIDIIEILLKVSKSFQISQKINKSFNFS